MTNDNYEEREVDDDCCYEVRPNESLNVERASETK